MQTFSSAKHWFVTAAKRCRGVCDHFFESAYENKNEYHNKQRYGNL